MNGGLLFATHKGCSKIFATIPAILPKRTSLAALLSFGMSAELSVSADFSFGQNATSRRCTEGTNPTPTGDHGGWDVDGNVCPKRTACGWKKSMATAETGGLSPRRGDDGKSMKDDAAVVQIGEGKNKSLLASRKKQGLVTPASSAIIDDPFGLRGRRVQLPMPTPSRARARVRAAPPD